MGVERAGSRARGSSGPLIRRRSRTCAVETRRLPAAAGHAGPGKDARRVRRLKPNILQPESAVLSDREDIIGVIEELFEAGITKDMGRLRSIHLDDPRFSSFSDLPPYDLKDYQTTIELEELRFVSISDYSYQIRNPKISVFGDVAVAAMELDQKGMLVDNKAYTGEHMAISGRATFVLVRQPAWKIAHIHLSKTG